MSRSAVRPIAGAILGPALGVALAVGLARVADPNRGRDLAGYAVGTVPLAMVIGALAAARAGRPSTGGAGRAVAGLAIALVAAATVSYLEASFRLHYLGSTGWLSATTILYGKEMLMLVGVLPAIAALGAVVARQPSRLGPFGAAALAGVLGAVLVGPTLLIFSLLAGST